MPNLANVLKSEIRRLARSEARSQALELKKSFLKEKQRNQALRKLVAEQQRELNALKKAVASGAPAPAEAAAEAPAIRWRKDTVAVLRKRHGLSQAALAKLVGVGLNTVWSWEKGRSAPRQKQLSAIAAIRDLDKAGLAERLTEVGLTAGRKKPGRKPGAAKKTAKKTAKRKTKAGNTRSGGKAGKTSPRPAKKAARKTKRSVKKSVRSSR